MRSLSQHHQGRVCRGRSGWLCLAVILAVIAACSGDETTLASVRDLRANLFQRYDKLVRPVILQSTATTVLVGMAPLAITDMDEDKQILEMDTWIVMKWKDEYLVWNPEEHGGVTSINLPCTEVWRPDITIYTGTPAKKILIDTCTQVIVNYTGDVLWVPPVTVRSRCPHNGESHQDTLTCNIRMGSWTYHEHRLDIQLHQNDMKLDDFYNINPYWELVSTRTGRISKYYSCCPDPYPALDFNITMRRKSTCKALKKSCYAQQTNHHHCSFTP